MYITNHFIILIYQLLRETKAYYVPDMNVPFKRCAHLVRGCHFQWLQSALKEDYYFYYYIMSYKCSSGRVDIKFSSNHIKGRYGRLQVGLEQVYYSILIYSSRGGSQQVSSIALFLLLFLQEKNLENFWLVSRQNQLTVFSFISHLYVHFTLE